MKLPFGIAECSDAITKVWPMQVVLVGRRHHSRCGSVAYAQRGSLGLTIWRNRVAPVRHNG